MTLPSSYFTRVSLGRRLQSALNLQLEQGTIRSWRTKVEDDHIVYEITSGGSVSTMTPGETEKYVNTCAGLRATEEGS
jgi:hypothetical protein